MKAHHACNYSKRTYICEKPYDEGKPKNPKPKVVCPECKRKINTGLIWRSENYFGYGHTRYWYLIVPKHKHKYWWKLKK